MPSHHPQHAITIAGPPPLAGATPPTAHDERSLTAPILTSSLEVIDSTELAKRLSVPESWIRSRTNKKRTTDPIPHYRLGRYVRFSWGSAELRDWLQRQLVSTDGVWSRR